MRRFWYAFLLLAAAALVGVLALAGWSVPLAATDVQTLRVANELYASGEPADAARLYQQLADSGVRSVDVYYNLGTAYAAAGQTGPAMRYLRLAANLAPRDPDVQANFALLSAETGPRPPARDLPQRLARALEPHISVDETAALAIGGWLLFALLIFTVGALRPGFFRSFLRAVSVLVGLLALAGILALGARLYVRFMEPSAIVVSANVSPSAEPGGSIAGRVVLAEGAEVAVLDRRGSWFQVLLPGSGNIGWIPSRAVRVVD